MDHFEVDANGFTFNATAAGPPDGRPVLFLHGFPQTSWSWHAQLEAMAAAGYRALAFDQRGYSATARPAEIDDYRLDALVSDVVAITDALGISRFDLVGHDWGAVVAWATAARHAPRIRTLTAVSVPHPHAFGAALSGGDDDQSKRSSYMDVFRQPGGVAETLFLGEDGSGDGLRRMFAGSGMAPDAPEIEVFVTAMLEPGALTAALNWYRAMTPEAFADVGVISVPTMYLWSTADIAIGRVAAEGSAQWVTGPYRFEVLEDVSHWIPETAPDVVNGLLVDFLGQH